jgi:CRP/FNR family transcriptional regulator, anaerobic regulatory protein
MSFFLNIHILPLLPNNNRMKEIVIGFLNSIHPLSTELQQQLHQLLKEVTLKKKEIYLREGAVSDRISFVISGLLRSYTVTDEGKETTCWFMKEGDVTISVKSFFERIASTEFIQALEPCTLLYITYDELEILYSKYPEFNVVGRLILQKYYVLSEERLAGIRNLKARERYDFLFKTHPEIIQRAPVQQLASYLDLDKRTINRLKAGK